MQENKYDGIDNMTEYYFNGITLTEQIHDEIKEYIRITSWTKYTDKMSKEESEHFFIFERFKNRFKNFE